jgi:hypothetical protein
MPRLLVTLSRLGQLAAIALAGFLIPLAAWAADPPFSVYVCRSSGAPGCTFIDGAALVSNASGTYWYRGPFTIT